MKITIEQTGSSQGTECCNPNTTSVTQQTSDVTPCCAPQSQSAPTNSQVNCCCCCCG